MDVTLSEDQLAVREAFAAFFRRESPTTRARASEPIGFDAGLWHDLVALGFPAMGVPEECGGGGAGLVELALVAEEVGRRVAPVPVAEAAVTARLLARGGEPAREWLDQLLSGHHIVTLAFRGLSAVPAGAIADAVVATSGQDIVVAQCEDRSLIHNLGSSPLGACSLGSDRTVLDVDFDRALDEWKVLTAASLVGIADQALSMAVDHAKDRHLFGRALGSFQTVAHRLADAASQLDGARFLVWEAAWAEEEHLDGFRGLASAAFAYATELAFDIAAASLHLHGGVGYTVEHDIQLYYRRAKAWPLVYGRPSEVYQEVATELWGAAS